MRRQLKATPRGIDGNEYPRGFQPDDAWKFSFFQQFPKTQNQPLLTLAGRITRLKGHEDLLKLVANLRDRGVAAHALIVVGADPRKAGYADEMKTLAATLMLLLRRTPKGTKVRDGQNTVGQYLFDALGRRVMKTAEGYPQRGAGFSHRVGVRPHATQATTIARCR